MTLLRISTLALVSALLLPSGLRAQDATDNPWAFLFGCWLPDAAALGAGPASISCIVPVAGDPRSAELVTVEGGAVARHAILRADGVPMPIDENGCTGDETAQISRDGRRVYIAGTVDCGDGVRRATTTLLALSPTEEWVEIHAVRTGTRTAVRTLKSSRMPLRTLTDAVRQELSGVEDVAAAARRKARPLPGADEIVDATGQLEPGVVETWLAAVAATTPFTVLATRPELERLQKAAIPASTIDMVVALGNPQHFRVTVANDGAASAVSTAELLAAAGGNRRTSGYAGASRPISAMDSGMCNRLYWDMASGLVPWGMPYASPGFGSWCAPVSCLNAGLFWGGYRWGRNASYPYWAYGYNERPVTVTGTPRNDRGGRMVKGRGYEQNPNAPSSQPVRPRGSSGTSATSVSRPTSSPSSSTGSSAAPASSGGRTAQPRNP